MPGQTIRRFVPLAAVLIILSTAAVSRGQTPAQIDPPQSGIAEDTVVFLPNILNKWPPLPERFASIADVDVIQGLPTSNFGDAETMWTGYHKGPCTDQTSSGKISRSLVRFDVSAIPAGTAITRATLNVRVVTACWSTRSSAVVTAYRVTDNWVETAATWNTQPKIAEAAGAVTVPLSSGVLNTYTLDITNLVRGWVNGSFPNNGLMLRSPEVSGNDFVFLSFATRTWSESYTPYLQLTYAGMLSTTTRAPDAPDQAVCTTAAEGVVACAPSATTLDVRP